jgi:beta-glucosidase
MPSARDHHATVRPHLPSPTAIRSRPRRCARPTAGRACSLAITTHHHAAALFQPGTSGEDHWRDAAMPILRSSPGVRRMSPRGLDLAQEVSDYHRVVWTGFIVPPETGTYRLGMNGVHRRRDEVRTASPSRTSASRRLGQPADHEDGRARQGVAGIRSRSRPTASRIGRARAWSGSAFRPTQMPRSEGRRRQADVLVAVVGLTSDLETEESPVEMPGFKGGDKTTLDLPPTSRPCSKRPRRPASRWS